MSKITLPAITNGQDLTTLNNNFALIAAQLNTNVLYRTNIGSEANTISQDIDFNSHKAYNLSDVLVAGVSVLTLTQTAAGASDTATAAALAAQASAVASNTQAIAAAASAAAAQATLSSSLLKANNFSDLPNVATAKINLGLVKADVGLGNVDNTSDVNKPVSTAQTNALALKANIASPILTGVPQSVTTASSDNSQKIATTAFVQSNFAAPQIPYGSATPNGVSATTISATGLITPASAIGIKGTAVGDNAQVGSIGEFPSQSGGGASNITSATSTSIGGIALSAGDWDVEVVGDFVCTVAAISSIFLGVSTTLNALGPFGSYVHIPIPVSTNITAVTPTVRISVAAPTTVYATGNVGFGSGTCTLQTSIRARRIR